MKIYEILIGRCISSSDILRGIANYAAMIGSMHVRSCGVEFSKTHPEYNMITTIHSRKCVTSLCNNSSKNLTAEKFIRQSGYCGGNVVYVMHHLQDEKYTDYIISFGDPVEEKDIMAMLYEKE